MLDPKGKTLKVGIIAATLMVGNSGFGQTKTETGEEKPATPSTNEQESPTPAVPNQVAPTKTSTDTKAPERIQVTGSRIRRVEVENSAPVTVIKKEDIAKSGTASLGDYFRKSASASPTGTLDGTSGSTVAGASSIDLLGLGGDRTLVLLNGKRLPTISGTNSVNIDNIPTALIERIEILAGGASAVYGADAVGGVVNIVTRKNFEGTEATAFINVPTHAGGEERSYSVTQGFKISDDANASLTAGYRHKNPIDKRNRDLLYAKEGRKNTASNGPAGTYSYAPIDVTNGVPTQGDFVPSANCPVANQIATIPGSPDIYCAGPRDQLPSQLIPERNEWYAGGTFDLSKGDWNTSVLVNYSRSMITSNSGHPSLASNPITTRDIYLSKDKAVQLGVLPATSTASYVDLLAPIPEYPDQIFRNTYNSFTSGVYLSGEIVPTWKTDFGLSYAQSETINESMKIRNSDALANLFSNPNEPDFGADPAYIPIDPTRNAAVLEGALGDLKDREKNETTSADAFVSKEVAKLPGGDLTVGFGASLAHETYKHTPDNKDLASNSIGTPVYFGSAADQGKGDRDITSVFGEFYAPVMKQILMEGALRFDNYSDFKSTVNYGIGSKITILPQLAIRGRAASSFKAPPLSYIHQKGGGGYLGVNDPKYCEYENTNNNGHCDPTNPGNTIYTYNPGNKNLDPENGVNYTAGIVLEPLPGLSIISDYYWVDLKKTFAQDDLQTVVDDWYKANPNSLVGGTINENTVTVDPTSGVVTKVGRPYRNLGTLQVQALSTKLAYKGNVGSFLYSLDSDHFRMLSRKAKESQFAEKRQQVRYIGVPAWRWTNSVSAGTKDHMGTLTARSTGKQGADPRYASPFELNTRVGEYTEYDAVYSGQLPTNTSIELGVSNIFNTLGGKITTNELGSEDLATNSLYQYTGRSYFLRATQRL